jgi:hypothetical protein
MANGVANSDDVANTENVDEGDVANAAPSPKAKGTYRYRDADKRRAYQRDLTRHRRVAARAAPMAHARQRDGGRATNASHRLLVGPHDPHDTVAVTVVPHDPHDTVW